MPQTQPTPNTLLHFLSLATLSLTQDKSPAVCPRAAPASAFPALPRCPMQPKSHNPRLGQRPPLEHC